MYLDPTPPGERLLASNLKLCLKKKRLKVDVGLCGRTVAFSVNCTRDDS